MKGESISNRQGIIIRNVHAREGLGYSLEIPPGSHTYYLKLASQNGLYTDLRVMAPQDYRRYIEKEKLFLAFFFGFLLSIILYNLFILISLKEKAYLYYVAFQISIFLLFLSYSGMGSYLFWEGNITLNELLYRKGEILALFFALSFAKVFLNTREHFVRLHRIITVTLGMLLFLLVTPWSWHGWLFRPVLIGTVLLGFVMIARAIQKRVPDAGLFFAATFFMLLGTLLAFLKIFGILDLGFVSSWAVYLGSMLEALLFSMALANRINLLKRREQELIRHQKEMLEREVARQTVSLRKMVSEKEVLLKEINHRIKNNLQMISSFVSFAALHSSERARFQNLKQRIQAIALLYNTLYRPEGEAQVDLPTYIGHLTDEIFAAYTPEVTLSKEIDAITLSLDKAIPLGLLVNEILTNMITHAFEAQENARIRLHIREESQGCLLRLEDNGKGFDPEAEHTGLGLKLIRRLSRKQLGGTLRIVSTREGSTFEVRFGCD